jgi:hypothetical protein
MKYQIKTVFPLSLFRFRKVSHVALLCLVIMSSLSSVARSAEAHTLQVGDEFGGGIVAYILQPGDPGFIAGEVHGFVAAKADQSDGAAWSNVTDANAVTGTALGSGPSNTAVIRKQPGHTASAAEVSVDYTVTADCSTYDDWYLPSRDELHKLYLNRHAIGAFADFFYWSSSGYDEKSVWSQNFSDGRPSFDKPRNFKARVRSIRSF